MITLYSRGYPQRRSKRLTDVLNLFQLVVDVGVRSLSITGSCTTELTQTVPYFYWIQFFIKSISTSSSSDEETIENYWQ
ncbi:unnamed protein product [Acanthoscelides obtectus]|uniref:Uncharacterized protein n=1 Tax=Acanthoscelides obtectus TaxID=200917 RepID=A0A9P0MA72_ACAOB|nr:unnamed protein product [Acanthoscelides obtectus]CAK1684186.1 hypothetical protein AOBTE_LOCUS34693 [Acanthoscelides obtectus]